MISNLYGLVEYMEQEYADQTAFQYYQDGAVRRVSFPEYCADIKRFASALRHEFTDIQGRHVAILAGNSYSYVVTLLGVILAGGVAIPVNSADSKENISYALSYCDVSLLLTDQPLPAIKEAMEFCKDVWDIQKMQNIARLQNTKLEAFSDNERCALILFSSGTTGRSKGVMYSQKNLFAAIATLANYIRSTSSDDSQNYGILLMMPMYHIGGFLPVLANNCVGKCINLCTSVSHLYQDILGMPSSSAFIVPALLAAWHKEISKGNSYKLGNIRTIYCGGASANVNLFNTFRDQGIKIFQAYGMTEISCSIAANTSSQLEKLGSVGMPTAGCEVRTVNNEVQVKSDAIMLGYYKDEAATKEIIQDGWLHTGDLGYLDEDGYLWLTGRKKNLIILSNGENVSPEELEAELMKHEPIWEAVVKEKNDKICAEIFCDEASQAEIKALIAEGNRGKSYYKRITEIEFRSVPFERNSQGKILRH